MNPITFIIYLVIRIIAGIKKVLLRKFAKTRFIAAIVGECFNEKCSMKVVLGFDSLWLITPGKSFTVLARSLIEFYPKQLVIPANIAEKFQIDRVQVENVVLDFTDSDSMIELIKPNQLVKIWATYIM